MNLCNCNINCNVHYEKRIFMTDAFGVSYSPCNLRIMTLLLANKLQKDIWMSCSMKRGKKVMKVDPSWLDPTLERNTSVRICSTRSFNDWLLIACVQTLHREQTAAWLSILALVMAGFLLCLKSCVLRSFIANPKCTWPVFFHVLSLTGLEESLSFPSNRSPPYQL